MDNDLNSMFSKPKDNDMDGMFSKPKDNDMDGMFSKPKDNDMDGMFSKPKDNDMDGMFSQPKSEMDSMFTKPKAQERGNDPRNGLSQHKIKEAEATRDSWKAQDKKYGEEDDIINTTSHNSFYKGFTHNMDEYGASINKGLDKVSKAILPKEYQTTFFKDNQKFWDDNRKMNEIETENSTVAKMAGKMLLDPVNITPAGIATKGGKLAKVGKSMAMGAGVGLATSKAKNYGNEDLTGKQKADEDVMSAGLVSVLNGVIAGLTKGKVSNAIKSAENLTGDAKKEADSAMEALANNPEAFGLSRAEAKPHVDEYKELFISPEGIKKSADTPPSKVPPQEAVDVFAHPRAKEAIDMARDRYASQTYSDRVGGGSSSWMDADGNYARAGAKGETNYHQGFNLSKADIKKIDDGNITPEIEQKIRDDIGRLENDPSWNSKPETQNGLQDDMAFQKVEQEMLDANGGMSMFTNAQHNLAGGVGTGAVNAGSGIFDENDTVDKMADRFINGMALGMVGVSGIKMLKKTNPEAYKKVQSWVIENNVKAGDKLPTDGVQLGVFAGKKAKGFDGKKTHAGKYDGQTRFEIDDSKMEVINDGVTELSSKGYSSLDRIIKHDELFGSYPQLRNVIVKFDKNMKEHATFDGEGTITLSNKFKNKDEMSSSIIHEIQHWVQNKEGFAGGGNFDDMVMKVDGQIDALTRKGELSALDAMHYKKDLDYLKDNRSAEAFEKYKNIAGEIEAREVQARKNLTPEEREVVPKYENTSTMGEKYGDEAYNDTFMAELDGKLGDFDSAGIDPKDASLDFSRSKVDNMGATTDSKTKHLKEITLKELNKDWTDISSGLFKSLRASFSDTFSGKYIQARDTATAGKHNMTRQAQKIQTALGHLPEQARKDIHEYIVADAPPHSVSPEVKKIGDNIRKTITDLQDELVAKGIYDQKDIDAWGENYLKREYESHINNGKGFFGGGFKLPSTMRRGKVEKMTQAEFDTKVMTGEIDHNLIGTPLKDGGIEKNIIGEKVELRRDWTKAERESMGEITDAQVTVPQTIMRMSQMVEHGKMLQEVAKIDGAIVPKTEVKLATPQALTDSGFIQLERKSQYGALSGQWVRKDVADDIGAMNKTLFQENGSVAKEATQAWLKYLSLWKKSKTVWNAPTHVNNIMANPFLMHSSGLSAREIGGGMIKSVLSMRKASVLHKLESKEIIGTLSGAEKTELGGLRAELKYYIEAESHGLLNTSRLEDIEVGQTTSFKERGKLGKLDDKLSKLYQDEDGMSKLAMFTHLREKGWSAEEARAGALAIMPDYSRPMAPAFRKLRDSGVTPFIAWTYYTLPKMLKLGLSGRGAFQVTKAIGSIYGASYMLTGIANPYSDELPEDGKMARVPISKDGNNITTVKMDRMNPFMQILNPSKFAQESIGQGLPQTALGSMMGVKLYNQRPVTNENKPTAQQWYDKAKYASGLLPIAGQAMGGVDLIEGLVRENKNRKRSTDVVPRTTTQNLLKQIGINSLTYDSAKIKKERKRKEKNATFW